MIQSIKSCLKSERLLGVNFTHSTQNRQRITGWCCYILIKKPKMIIINIIIHLAGAVKKLRGHGKILSGIIIMILSSLP